MDNINPNERSQRPTRPQGSEHAESTQSSTKNPVVAGLTVHDQDGPPDPPPPDPTPPVPIDPPLDPKLHKKEVDLEKMLELLTDVGAQKSLTEMAQVMAKTLEKHLDESKISDVEQKKMKAVVLNSVDAEKIQEDLKKKDGKSLNNTLVAMIMISSMIDQITKINEKNEKVMLDFHQTETKEILAKQLDAIKKRRAALNRAHKWSIFGKVMGGIVAALGVAGAVFTGGATLAVVAAVVGAADFANTMAADAMPDGQNPLAYCVGKLVELGCDKEEAQKIAGIIVMVSFIVAELGLAVGAARAAGKVAIEAATEATEAGVDVSAAAGQGAGDVALKTATQEALDSALDLLKNPARLRKLNIFKGIVESTQALGSNVPVAIENYNADQAGVDIQKWDRARIDNQAQTQPIIDLVQKMISNSYKATEAVTAMISDTSKGNQSIAGNV